MMGNVEAGSIRVVFISVPRNEANKLAQDLVEQRLAACINIIPKTESYFWWDDAVQHDDEALLICKTTEAKIQALIEYTQDVHPNELPEIIAFPLSEGLPEYLAWVSRETEE
jgi:periplasmic divalent cation tolerance protein